MTEPFFLGVGGPWCQTATAMDVPQPILDNQTTTSLLTVGSAMTLTDVRVPVNITHTYIGDLVIELTSPSSTPVVLHNRDGGSSDDIVGTYGENLTPAEPLSVLLGETSGGIWQLTVTDNAGSDEGILNSWSLSVCEEPVEATTPKMRLSDVSADPAGVQVEWWSYPGLTSYRVYRATDPSAAGNFADVTIEDGDDTDTRFLDTSTDLVVFYLVTGIGPQGEGPKGHFGE
jgi:subtilisin-like proprotein convertase family protein